MFKTKKKSQRLSSEVSADSAVFWLLVLFMLGFVLFVTFLWILDFVIEVI